MKDVQHHSAHLEQVASTPPFCRVGLNSVRRLTSDSFDKAVIPLLGVILTGESIYVIALVIESNFPDQKVNFKIRNASKYFQQKTSTSVIPRFNVIWDNLFLVVV